MPTKSRGALSNLARVRIMWGGGAAALTAVLILLWSNLSSPAPPVPPAIAHSYAAGDSQFIRVMSSLLGPPMVGGNRVRTLLNGDQSFPAMLAAIRSARRSVDFESYIYWSGQVGRDFADALSERARAGVATHVLIDWAGSWVKSDRAVLDQMRAAGIEVVMYRPLRWYDVDRINNRTHRKLLIVDGRIGFTGGLGIADQWRGHAQDKDHWRDTQFQVEGPVVAQLQAAFLDNWIETEGRVLEGESYFPPPVPAGSELAQAFRSSPGEGSASMRLMYLLAIASATRSIRIANAYFVPDSVAVAMLVAARRRNVEVEIIVPGPILDAQLVRRASRAMWGPLLEAGARIYEYQPTMFHVKVMVVDDTWVSVGSTNFDDRSFRLNDEANLNVVDPTFAREQVRVFDDDRGRSRQITFEAWRHRPLWERLRERWALAFRSQI
jgi:cardiolipin synthase